jgi:hypothetical protein
MTSRAVGLIGFAVCAGITGVWTMLDLERVYFFTMFLGLAALIHSRSKTTEEQDPMSIHRIKAIMYAQGLRHGADRATSPTRGESSQHLHRVS